MKYKWTRENFILVNVCGDYNLSYEKLIKKIYFFTFLYTHLSTLVSTFFPFPHFQFLLLAGLRFLLLAIAFNLSLLLPVL